MKISKDLLSEVLKDDRKLDNDIILCIDKVSVRYGFVQIDGEISYYNINIYELAHKIEDWIESKDINVIRIKENKLYEFYINAYIDEETNELFFENSITSETKIKGIIAVGEFILKEIKWK